MTKAALLLIMTIVLGMLAACSGSAPVFTPPPQGIGDTVVVPTDLQIEYSALVVAQAYDSLPEHFELLNLKERRALGLYLYAVRENINPFTLHLVSSVEKKDKSLQVAEQLVSQLSLKSLIRDGGFSNIYSDHYWGITLYFEELHTRGELAWYSDWIMQHYGEDFLVAYPGGKFSLAGE